MEAQNKDFGAGLQMYWLSMGQAVVFHQLGCLNLSFVFHSLTNVAQFLLAVNLTIYRLSSKLKSNNHHTKVANVEKTIY